jgi:hypothetical protein
MLSIRRNVKVKRKEREMDAGNLPRITRRQRRVLPFLRAIFTEIAVHVIGDQAFRWANRYGHKTDGRIRSWLIGGVPWDWQAALRVMGVPPEIVHWPPEERRAWLEKNIPVGKAPPRLKHGTDDPAHCETLERAVGNETEPGSTAICPVLNPVEIISNSALRAGIKVYLVRGINFLFIVPKTFGCLDLFLAVIASLKSGNDRGCVRVAVVERPWKYPKAAVIVVGSEIEFTMESPSKAQIENVTRASAHLWQVGDEFRPRRKLSLREHRNWIFIPAQDIIEILLQISRWLPSAELE